MFGKPKTLRGVRVRRPKVQYLAGIHLFNRGDYRGAAIEFEVLLMRGRKTSFLYRRLAEFYLVRALRNSAIQSFYDGNFSSCIMQCKQALAVNPDEFVCRNYLAHASHHIGQYGAAIKHFRELQKRHPEREAIRLNLAKLLIKSDQLAEALPLMNDLLEQFPRYVDYRLVRGILHSRAGNSELAIADFKHGQEVNSRFQLLFLLMALEYIKIGEFEKSIETIKSGLAQHPDEKKLEFYLHLLEHIARTIKEPDSRAEAITDIDFIIDRADAELEVALNLDISFGEYFSFLDPIYDIPCLKSLIETFRAEVRKHPNFADYVYKLALFYIKIREYATAQHFLDKALKLNPKYKDALSIQVKLFESQEKFDAALVGINLLLEMDAENAQHLMAKGRILVKLERPKEAVAPVLAAVRKDTSYFYQLYMLGMILKDSGDLKQAASCLQPIVGFLPDIKRELYRIEKKLAT